MKENKGWEFAKEHKWNFVAVFGLMFALVAIISVLAPEKYIEAPAGYQVVQSKDGSKWAFIWPNGIMSAGVWDSRRGAVEIAVRLKADEDKKTRRPSDNYKWEKNSTITTPDYGMLSPLIFEVTPSDEERHGAATWDTTTCYQRIPGMDYKYVIMPCDK